jgi:hypothetical protein
MSGQLCIRVMGGVFVLQIVEQVTDAESAAGSRCGGKRCCRSVPSTNKLCNIALFYSWTLFICLRKNPVCFGKDRGNIDVLSGVDNTSNVRCGELKWSLKVCEPEMVMRLVRASKRDWE